MSSENAASSRQFVQSLARGLAVIDTFDQEHSSLSLSEVARRAGINRAATRRFLHTLVHLGYADFDGKKFSLKPKILSLGYSYLSSLGLLDIAQPLMEELVATVHESCSASVLDEFDVVYVARAQATERTMSISLNIGSRLPAHATSMGLILLAGLDPEKLDNFLTDAPLKQYTVNTVTDPEALHETIDRVRVQGYALVVEELELGLCSISVPITDRSNQVIAALNLSTQSNRHNNDDIVARMLLPLKNCAQNIIQALSHQR